MEISVPSSWLPGLQGALILTLAAGFFFDQPLALILALALSALLMTQDEEGVPAEYRPVTALLIISGLLFLAEYASVAWGIALFCAAYAAAVLLGARLYQAGLQVWQKGPGARPTAARTVRRRR